MHIKSALLIAVSLCSTHLFASPIYLSATRTVDVYGSNSLGQSYADSASSAASSGAFNQSVNGAVLGASSNASQISNIGADGISLLAHTTAALFSGSFASPVTSSQAHMSTLLEVSFLVTAPLPVTLAGYRDNSTLGGLIDLQLTSSSGNLPLVWGGSIHNNFLNFTGVLAPDTYTLTARQTMTYTIMGSTYDAGSLHLEMSLKPVPDAVSPLPLLLAGLVVLAAVRQGWRGGLINRA